MLPPSCRTHEDHDDRSGGLKIVGGKSTDFSFGTAIPNHSRPARRLILAAAYGSRFELWGTRIVRCSWSQPGGYPRSYSPDQGPYSKTICDEPVGFDGRRRSFHFDGRSIPSQSGALWQNILKVSGEASFPTARTKRFASKIRYKFSSTKGFPYSALSLAFRPNRSWMSSADGEPC